MTAIFIHGVAHRFIEHSGRAGCPTKLDEFAELLAEGATPQQASFEVYGTSTRGNTMLQRLRQRLGPQAC